jgi:transcription initiation factor TFIIE subunit alpha
MDNGLDNPAIRIYLHRLIGDEGIELLEKFPKEGEYSDEDLASTTGINLNAVRHSLYSLYEKRLAEYRRIKNNETGWLTYLWQLKMNRMPVAIREDLETVLDKLSIRERYEEINDFYICKECKEISTFSSAIDREFICEHCKCSLDHFDNEVRLVALKRRIHSIKDALGLA